MRLIFTCLLLLSFAVSAEVEQSWPNLIIADEGGVPIDGVPGSTTRVNALEKVLNLPYGTYKVIRPDATITTSEDVVIPPVVEPPVVEPPIEPPIEPPAEPPIVTPTDDISVVYSRVPRTVGPHTVATKTGELVLNNAEVWDVLPEVATQFYGFNAPGQLMLQHSDDSEELLYDCFDKARPCVPFDAMPSLDGKHIAFAVYSADNLVNAWSNGVTLPNVQLGSQNADSRIYVINVETKELIAWPHTPGDRDTSPVWLPDGRLMFTSTRNGQWRPWLNKITPMAKQDPRLFTALPDGSDVVDISPHEVGGAMHPFVFSNGRVGYNSLWYSHNLTYVGNNGSINWPTTLNNMWMMADILQDGSDYKALLGGHKNAYRDSRGRTKTQKALHFIGQRENGDACIGSYYRANNHGLGDIACFPFEPAGVEGPAPDFLPTGIYSVASWSKSNDEPSRKDANGVRQGKIGFPDGYADNQLLLTVCSGYCTKVATSPPFIDGQVGDDIGSSIGLYKTTVIPSENMDDLEVVVDHPDWHEFNGRIVRPRVIQTAALSQTDDGSCQVISSDAGATDAHDFNDSSFNRRYRAMANNGGEIKGLDHSEVQAIRFYEVLPNLDKSPDFKNSIGNVVKLLGDAPLLADNSFKVELPCDMPYLMAGVDKDGLIIKRDQLPQSLRPGEKRVCTGCHLHGEEGRPYEQSLAFAAPPLPLVLPTAVPTFEKDIKPIFEGKCAGCHTVDLPVLDYDKLVWDYLQEFVPDDRKHVAENTTNLKKKYGLQRPNTSKYVNTMFARESLLYWKAANKRTDGRTDDTYADDIDFGVDHPTTLTAIELRAVGEWLDGGAAR